MRRFPFALRIDSDNYSEFYAHLENSWPTLTSFLKENQIRNFSLWEADGIVFGYAEGDSDLCLSPVQKKLLSSISESFTPFINWSSLLENP